MKRRRKKEEGKKEEGKKGEWKREVTYQVGKKNKMT